jgi:hypothetical protein
MSKELLEELAFQKDKFNNELGNIRFIKNKQALYLKEEADKLKYVKKNSLNAIMHNNLPSKADIYESTSKRFKSAWKDPGF